MSKTHPTYTRSFKQQAVHVLETSGKSKAEIARDLGISESALRKWWKEFGEQGEEASPEKGHQNALEEERRRLKRENEMLWKETETLKKSGEYLGVASSVKFQFIDEHRHQFPILRMCQVLGVSETGYYNWRKRGKSKRKQEDERLSERIEEAYGQHGGTYGSPRIHAVLKTQGVHCGRKRVARLMREHNLAARRTGFHSI